MAVMSSSILSSILDDTKNTAMGREKKEHHFSLILLDNLIFYKIKKGNDILATFWSQLCKEKYTSKRIYSFAKLPMKPHTYVQ